MCDLLQPEFPPPVSFEPPVAFTTAAIGKTISPSDRQRWLDEICQRRSQEEQQRPADQRPQKP